MSASRVAGMLWAVGCGLWASGSALLAQSAQPTVYLLTIGQGEYVWEKFGHNALLFRDAATGVDVAYNWGVFDFAQPDFLKRFLTGDTRYWVEAYPGQALIDYYRRSNRTVTLQRLNFTPDQARRAYQFSQWNAREANKYYRYDYFRDNCSTRLRDVIDLALGGALKSATARQPVPRSYRSESVRLVDDLPVTQFGLTLALGRPADRPLSVWEDMFIPMRLRDAIRLVRVPRAGGSAVPLVAEERVLFESSAYAERGTEPTLWIPYLLIGLLLAAEFLSVGLVASRARVMDVVFRAEVAIWGLLVGTLGLILLLAWTTTQHVFWFRNENMLLVNPLSLLLGAAALLSVWKPRFARGASTAAIVIAALGVVALALKVIPGSPQQNLAVILLLLPPQVAMAIGLWRRSQSPRLTSESRQA